ncbi:uncharacterized protein Z520_09267 [Fonsecaea multimorphosa CBS 102226]|uniref:Uncharacterized protein n=1 Tax=Fonsecaea multimorphosa CBS 102226 TaxID=1442371 RepID=A0A0D2JNR7_9EURO|nr:uncharacterized protein Z520_09267 [Fonsecaea multimorphosa CBS 102226]KIX94957.1 hypothetical protein Z520_09267 [Fonsecaea multimorphosa CBS 102226]OAL20608.1 hypothetical protein AYO22_08617 [Fonsecaea multimorphosa]
MAPTSANASAEQDLSPQDSTFLFISTLQEQLAKSEFVTSINSSKPAADSQSQSLSESTPSRPNKDKESSRTSVVASSSSSSMPTTTASSSSTTKPIVPKWTDKDSQGARITRLKPPRQAK